MAARHADDVWRTHWFDPELERMERALQQAFGERHAVLFSWDRARSKVLIEVEGADTSAEIYLYDAERGEAQPVGVAYPELAPFGLLARRAPIAYPARDGTMIPGYLTTPPGVAGPAPLVVLPHGGPEARDYGGFDWIAHFLASRGYLVLQPNFRGSDGYGTAFRNAGRGQWGGLMQDDVTDGARYVIDEGIADPERVCIFGLSYGGYAALAGAVKTPELYDCVVAVAPVTDLPAMIRWAKDRYGRLSWIVDYWSQITGGDVSADDARIVAASLTGRADAVAAPILLIHGVDDTTVPIDQSERMEAALRRAGKDVTFIRLRGEDHYLYRPETRLEAMQAVEAFLAEHLGK